MDLTGMIQNPVEDQNSEQKVIERRVCSFKETGAGRNVDADRWTGTVGVQGWSVLAEVSGFYDRAV